VSNVKTLKTLTAISVTFVLLRGLSGCIVASNKQATLSPRTDVTPPSIASPTPRVNATQTTIDAEVGISREEDTELTTHYEVAVTAPGNAATLPGSTVVYTFTVTNLGINADTYTVTVGSSLGWANLSGIPTSLALSGGASMEIPIAVNMPPLCQFRSDGRDCILSS